MNRDDSALLAFVLALAASLLVHGPVYAVLGVFADTLLASAARERPEPPPPSDAEPEWMELVEDPSTEDPSDPSVPTTTTPEVAPTESPREERAERPRARPFRETEEAAAPPPPPPPPAPRTVVPPPDPALHAIDQRSHDPSVEPPPDTQFVAQENRSVEEQTVATERSVQGNQDESADETPEVELPEEVVNEGNATDDLLAERRAEDGADEGRGVEAGDEAITDGEAGEVRRVAAFGNQRDESATTDRRDEREGASSEAATRAPRVETETVVINDGIGSFVVRRPVAGTGGDASSERDGREARGRGSRGEGGGARDRRRLGLGRGRTADGPNLRLSWSDFESVIGEEQLREERESALAERQTRQRGRHAERTRRWREFRAAIENFVSDVRPGNQTALNARAHPFAAYIGELHRRLHVHYHAFVDNIPADPTHPFNQGALETTLEIVLRPDGEIDHVGVVRTSGLTLFDFSAWKAVMDAKPYPPAPENIRSVDGNVYVHYTFYRDTRFCHPSNAAPYILSEVPRRRSEPTTGPGTEVAVPQGARAWSETVEN